jgi:hypothetical protein
LTVKLGASDSNANGNAFRRFRFILEIQVWVGVNDHEPAAPHTRLGYVHLLSSSLLVVVSRWLNAIPCDGNS